MRIFSVQEATELVPLLQSSFEGVRARSARVAAIAGQLAARGDRSEPFTPVPEELPADHRELRLQRDELVSAIRESLAGIVELGIEIRRPDGLVDFRARRGGRTVLLCWRYGEKSVEHWHELGETYAGRRAIGDARGFEPRYPN